MYASVIVTMATMLIDNMVMARQQYGMYVWTEGFDKNVTGCDQQEFLKWNTSGSCFTHVWSTAGKRQLLWATCNLAGREIDTIFVSDVYHNLKTAHDTSICQSSEISVVKDMLREGHAKVLNLKIYGLYASNDKAVTEKDLVKYIVFYNDRCAESASERFDGVATNNEAYAKMKCGNMAERVQYLNDLNKIVTEARKQRHGTLLTHYSMGWHWAQCNVSSLMTWNGRTSDVIHHMIDIFHSTDVQVGYITQPKIAERMKIAGVDYAQTLNKPIFATVYTNKESPCQVTFFPNATCSVQGHTESAMYSIFDSFQSHNISYARPCIHYFRGVYSTGIHQDWPIHI